MKKSKKSESKKRSGYDKIDHRGEVKRLNRIIGQIEGVRKMLEKQRNLESVLIQCKAIHSALRSIESRVLKAHLEITLDSIIKIDKKKNRAEKVAELEQLYKHAS